MNWDSLVSWDVFRPLIASVGGLFAYALFIKKKNENFKTDKENFILTLPNLFWLCGCVFTLASMWSSYQYYGEDGKFSISIMFSALGVYGTASCWFEQVSVTSNQIKLRSLLNTTEIQWRDVKAVRYRSFLSQIVILSSNKRIRIYSDFIGFLRMIEFLIKKVPPGTVDSEVYQLVDTENP